MKCSMKYKVSWYFISLSESLCPIQLTELTNIAFVQAFWGTEQQSVNLSLHESDVIVYMSLTKKVIKWIKIFYINSQIFA